MYFYFLESTKVIYFWQHWYWLTSYLVPFRSYHSLLFKLWTLLRFWATLWGPRDNVRCSSWAHWKARSGLPITVNWTCLLRVMAEALPANIDWKLAFSLKLGQFDPNFQREGVAPTNRSSFLKTSIIGLSCGIKCGHKFISFCDK